MPKKKKVEEIAFHSDMPPDRMLQLALQHLDLATLIIGKCFFAVKDIAEAGHKSNKPTVIVHARDPKRIRKSKRE